MFRSGLRLLKSPSFLFFTTLAIVITLVFTFSRGYFSEPVFYVDNSKYTLYEKNGNHMIYHNKEKNELKIELLGSSRSVYLNGRQFSIAETQTAAPYGGTAYEVQYPSGRTYSVQDFDGTLIAFDEQGEVLPTASIYVNNERVLAEGEEQFYPGSLVRAAYPQYHDKPGQPAFLFMALFLLVYGWCCFRYHKFQTLMFWLSLRWVWVNDPEPSDFHYFMCRVSGVLIMLGSMGLAIKAF